MPDRKMLPDVGIHVYGCAAIVLGLVELAWGDFAFSWHPVPLHIPYRTALAYLVGVWFVAAGLAMQWRRTARIGLAGAAALYLIAALFWAKRVIFLPGMIGTWLGFAEQFALVVAAAMTYTLLLPSDLAWGPRVRQLSRQAFGFCAVIFALAHFIAVEPTAKLVPAWIPPGQYFWAIATGVFYLLAGLAILSGIRALLAARMLTLMFVGFGVLIWIPTVVFNPHAHNPWAANGVNLAAAGAAWMVADAIARVQPSAKYRWPTSTKRSRSRVQRGGGPPP